MIDRGRIGGRKRGREGRTEGRKKEEGGKRRKKRRKREETEGKKEEVRLTSALSLCLNKVLLERLPSLFTDS